jgi:hypothetical protein
MVNGANINLFTRHRRSHKPTRMVGARGLAAALPVPRTIVPPAIAFGAQEGGLRTLEFQAPNPRLLA